MMKNHPILLLFSIVFMHSSGASELPESTTGLIYGAEELIRSDGQELLEKRCMVCHDSATRAENRLAPPMYAIQTHYINKQTTLDEFTTELSSFVLNPDVEESKMPNAIQKFGLMPAMLLTEKQLESIATYIYQTNFAKPQRYKNQNNNGKALRSGSFSYLQLGQKYANMAQAILGKNLMKAIHEKGTSGALKFCNENAISLTANSVTDKNTKIKRVSDNNRNQQNTPNSQELDYIHYLQKQIKHNKKLEPRFVKQQNTVVGYYPITTKPICLQCHGMPDVDIKPETLKLIDELYPDDKAIGYGLNQLRGIWVVEMSKRPNNRLE